MTSAGPAEAPGHSGPGMPRRALLASGAIAATGLLATGCKGISVLGTPPQPLPDVALLRSAITAERLMIARYRAVMPRVPSLRGALSGILSQHQAHLETLQGRLIDPHPPATPPTTRVNPATVPASSGPALAYLRDAEHAAAGRLLAHLETAPPSLAQLLVSIAASEATHAVFLDAPGLLR